MFSKVEKTGGRQFFKIFKWNPSLQSYSQLKCQILITFREWNLFCDPNNIQTRNKLLRNISLFGAGTHLSR